MSKTEFLALIDRLICGFSLSRCEWKALLLSLSVEEKDYLAAEARRVSKSVFGNGVYVRGLVEISSFCKNNCYYCGLRCANRDAERYRLSQDEILECCSAGAVCLGVPAGEGER